MADDNQVMAVFAERLRLRMKLHTLSKEYVAALVGVSATAVTDWLRSKCAPSSRYIPALSKVLKCSPQYLLGMRKQP